MLPDWVLWIFTVTMILVALGLILVILVHAMRALTSLRGLIPGVVDRKSVDVKIEGHKLPGGGL